MSGTVADGSDPLMALMITGIIGGIVFLVIAPLLFRYFMNRSRDRYKD